MSNCTTIAPGLTIQAQGVVFDLAGLYAEFGQLTDKRQARGKRYPLVLVLLLIVLAKLCGQDRPYGIAQWISARAPYLIAMLGLSCRRLPSLNTYRRVLQSAVDLAQLQEVVRRFLRRGSVAQGNMLITIDGKTLRGSFSPEQGQAIYLTEVVYGLTSLSRPEADATRLLASVRSYWGIENGLFYRRDTTLQEDATRMTHPALAQAMATLNNLVIGLVLQQGWRYLPEARRYYNAHLEEALALLLHPPD